MNHCGAQWIPACAGMTDGMAVIDAAKVMGFRLRGNDIDFSEPVRIPANGFLP